MTILKLLIIVSMCYESAIAWTMHETSLPQQPHHFDIRLTAKMSHLSLEANFDHLIKLSKLVQQMKEGAVFDPVSNGTYQQLGTGC